MFHLLSEMSFGFNYRNYFIYVFLTNFIAFCFNHNADHRFCTAFPYQDAARIA